MSTQTLSKPTKELPEKFEPGYYLLANKKTIVEITYDSGKAHYDPVKYPRKIYAESLQGIKIEKPEAYFAGATPVDYQPSIAELWELAKTSPMQEHKHSTKEFAPDDPIIWMDRFQLFFRKLFEFNHIQIETLGYYGSKQIPREKTYEPLVRDLTYKIAEKFYFHSQANSPTYAQIIEDIETWTNNPTEEATRAFFKKHAHKHEYLDLDVSTDCPITGESFRWICEGKTIKPVLRHLLKKESDDRKEKLTAELNNLRSQKTLSPEETTRMELLETALEKHMGWVKTFDLLYLTPALPFGETCADPITGKFPKVGVEIDVPTGKLVFANSLFDYLKDLPEEEENSQENSVNHTRGKNNNALFHARENQAFFVSLSNCSPSVWQNKKNPDQLRVGRAHEEPEYGEWTYEDAHKEWNEVGSICTDLWAFHACDRSRLPEKIEASHFTVHITPGRYRLTNHFEHEEARSGIFCEIEKVEASPQS